MYQKTSFSPFGQIGLFLAFMGVGLVLAAIALSIIGMQMGVPLSQMANVLTDPKYIDFIKLSQIVSTFMMMAVPAILFAWIVYKKPFDFMGFNRMASGKQVFIVVLMLVPAIFASGALGELNKMIPLSASMAAKFKAMEEAYSQQVMFLANMKNFSEYLLSLLILALLPAVFEEMLFRGALQKMLTNIMHNAWAAIIITSILFSAFHLSFYGFLPRLFLGILLGYIFNSTRNIWLNILLHFLNNALIVSQMYWLSINGKLTKAAIDETVPISYGIIAIPVIIYLAILLSRESKNVIGHAILEETLPSEENKPL
jgi:membrane protease YdiL (CAAX protease family)